MHTIEDRFWAKVDKTNSADDCWEWIAGKHLGYGRMNVKGTIMGSHRYSYQLHNGPIPAGLVVRHKCDNPSCVNPSHLELGTKADNNRDRHSRNRSASDKLTVQQAHDIKYVLRHCEAMRKYPFVSQTTITRIRTNKIWKHI